MCSKCTAGGSQSFLIKETATTDLEVLEAIGWIPTQTGCEKDWMDELCGTSEGEDDLRNITSKGARGWQRRCIKFAEDSEKAPKI